MEHDRTILNAVISGVVASIGVLGVLITFYGLLGIFTGVFGICAFAPEWWENIYYKLIYLIPVLSVLTGIAVGKYTINKSIQNFDNLS